MGAGIDILTAAFLGAVQGATEFLPVSSSGHVALGAMLFGVSDTMPLAMVVLLHFGTLLATCALLREDVGALVRSSLSALRSPRETLQTDEGKTLAAILVASVPTAVIGLFLESRVEEFARIEWVLGAGLLVSAALVLTTLRGGGERTVLPLRLAFVVGVCQGMAVMPGVSRSGTTIAVAMMLGMSGAAAFRFSFLLSLPAVAGAVILSLRHYEQLAELGVGVLVGGVVSLVVGYLALLWLRRLVDQGRFWIFALYLVPLGLGLVTYPLWSSS